MGLYIVTFLFKIEMWVMLKTVKAETRPFSLFKMPHCAGLEMYINSLCTMS